MCKECEGSVSAAKVELWPQELMSPGARNWEDLDPREANEQAVCLSPDVGGIHTACVHVHAHMHVHVSFPLLDLPHN